ncbi:hypothetical protein PUN28_005038 [Cardiocondyla obscurior]|uniref:Uncharacterized protein n=1 Tax=Cardiocondyla obscurior TaxID=286306 RepID=A0AAW2GFN2_9HYME
MLLWNPASRPRALDYPTFIYTSLLQTHSIALYTLYDIPETNQGEGKRKLDYILTFVRRSLVSHIYHALDYRLMLLWNQASRPRALDHPTFVYTSLLQAHSIALYTLYDIPKTNQGEGRRKLNYVFHYYMN